uniref:Uncharacterized protein n=1 Tax=Chromera velia CCMP2878 TaxID=1169474 RepID=A0A0G4FRT9_9ALVE|eukprot:Cvel_18351.t1-p1 / transcript=Cvel_18351.t1 / gene=Cvel_18351 / organism=Chromera_velia_CCMP2878 / gene_product=hypothetical protein / transcript_product=hypothetical protein / location=Cvel_scaffold1516:18604-26732(-) / protein_length=276 / sequence_SO=supercontig / SO=protein_coding / is_pseudo=false
MLEIVGRRGSPLGDACFMSQSFLNSSRAFRRPPDPLLKPLLPEAFLVDARSVACQILRNSCQTLQSLTGGFNPTDREVKAKAYLQDEPTVLSPLWLNLTVTTGPIPEEPLRNGPFGLEIVQEIESAWGQWRSQPSAPTDGALKRRCLEESGCEYENRFFVKVVVDPPTGTFKGWTNERNLGRRKRKMVGLVFCFTNEEMNQLEAIRARGIMFKNLWKHTADVRAEFLRRFPPLNVGRPTRWGSAGGGSDRRLYVLSRPDDLPWVTPETLQELRQSE